jgi:hypothetical protein
LTLCNVDLIPSWLGCGEDLWEAKSQTGSFDLQKTPVLQLGMKTSSRVQSQGGAGLLKVSVTSAFGVCGRKLNEHQLAFTQCRIV